ALPISAAIRQTAEEQCACASATRRRSYMSCVTRVVHEAVASGALPRRCKAAVTSCEEHSVCGKPAHVTCCRTTADGTTRCQIKRNMRACLAQPQAWVSSWLSTCDACPGGRCTDPTTTTTCSPTTTTAASLTTTTVASPTTTTTASPTTTTTASPTTTTAASPTTTRAASPTTTTAASPTTT